MTAAAQTTAELTRLLRDLRTAPREIQAGTRRVMRGVGATVLEEAASGAAWSSRIPDALRMRVTLAGSQPGVELRVDVRSAPHARVFEGFSGAVFRHPVFERVGRPTVWVSEAARPYLVPAANAGAAELVEKATAAAHEALTRHNL